VINIYAKGKDILKENHQGFPLRSPAYSLTVVAGRRSISSAAHQISAVSLRKFDPEEAAVFFCADEGPKIIREIRSNVGHFSRLLRDPATAGKGALRRFVIPRREIRQLSATSACLIRCA